MKATNNSDKMKYILCVSNDVFNLIDHNISVPITIMPSEGAWPKEGSDPSLLLDLNYELRSNDSVNDLPNDLREMMKSPRNLVFIKYIKTVRSYLSKDDFTHFTWSRFFADPFTIKEKGNSKHIVGLGFANSIPVEDVSDYKQIGSLMKSSTKAINRILGSTSVRGDMDLYGFMGTDTSHQLVDFCLLWLSDSVVLSKDQLNSQSVLVSKFDSLMELDGD